MAKLTNAKHEKFCQEYIKNPNGKQAYLATYGGDDKIAEGSASRLLGNAKVSERIRELQDAAAIRIEVSQDKLLRRLAEIAFGHIGMICSWSDNELTVKASDTLTPQEMSAIDYIDISPIGDGDGGCLGYRKRIKMRDSLKACEMLAKYLGLFDGSGAKSKDREAIKARLLELLERRAGD